MKRPLKELIEMCTQEELKNELVLMLDKLEEVRTNLEAVDEFVIFGTEEADALTAAQVAVSDILDGEVEV